MYSGLIFPLELFIHECSLVAYLITMQQNLNNTTFSECVCETVLIKCMIITVYLILFAVCNDQITTQLDNY